MRTTRNPNNPGLVGALLLGAGILLLYVPMIAHAALIDINTASEEELQALTGIGEVISARIVEYRKTNGDFATIEDIMNVKGIGPATFDDIKDSITVLRAGGTTDDTSAASEDEDDSGTSAIRPSEPTSGRDVRNQKQDTTQTSIAIQTRAYALANAPHAFTAQIRGARPRLLDPRWNFGDGATGRGNTVSHTYRAPGEYTVTARVYVNNTEYLATETISVGSVDISLDTAIVGEDGYITLSNASGERADLSGWELRAGGERFVFPPYTYIGSGARISIPNTTSGFRIWQADSIRLMYPDGRVARVFPSPRSDGAKTQAYAEEPSAQLSNQTSNQASRSTPRQTTTQPARGDVSEKLASFERADADKASQERAAAFAAASGVEESGLWPWLLGLAALLGSAVLVFSFTQKSRTIAGYTIKDAPKETD